MAHGIKPVLPFDLILATFLVPNLTNPMTTAELIATWIRQLQRREDDLAVIHANVLKSRFESVQQFEQHVKPSLPLSSPHPSIHPSYYSLTILWLFKDCKTNPPVHLSASNTSQPPMQHIIWHEDGWLITLEEWKSIQQSVVLVAHTWLDVLSTGHLPPSATSVPQKKVFYRHHFLKEWLQALRELELLTPLLSLCGSTWKAEKVLGSVLQDKPTHLSSSQHNPHVPQLIQFPHLIPTHPLVLQLHLFTHLNPMHILMPQVLMSPPLPVLPAMFLLPV
ncbi:hypothetical protein EI94DRAFT_1822438 [Lactarius quietus]|nr:hypothetical protein EI94DRAFT_1822438 [Lactarius quietus]